MAELSLLGVSQSSLLLHPKSGFRNITTCSIQSPLVSLRLQSRNIREFVASPQKKPQRHLFFKLGVVSSDSTTPTIANFDSETKEIQDIQPDSTGSGGEDGFGGGGGGGGGGDRNEGEGGSEESEGKKMAGMSMSQKLTLGFAALVGVGGVMGYIKSGSQKSLLAGGISAALLYYVYTQLPTNPVLASSLGLGLSAALLGVMGSRFKKSGKIFPAGVVSLVSFVMTGGYLHGILRSMH